MSPTSLQRSRALGAMVVPLALAGVFVSVSIALGQIGDDEPAADAGANTQAEIVDEPVQLVGSTLVTVVGDGLLTGSNVAPVRNGTCAQSERAPVERAAANAPGIVLVDNLACRTTDFTSVALRQIPLIDPESSTVFVGGGNLEFDWPALHRACLDPSVRTAEACAQVSDTARAASANAFFSWRSLLRQISRRAPGAQIVVVGAPTPVSGVPLRIGSACCDTRTDGHRRVRAVFDTAGSARRAVVEALAPLDIVHVELDDIVAGHELDTSDPWLAAADTGLHGGELIEPGVAALATELGPFIPDPPTLGEAAEREELVRVDVVLAATPAMRPNIAALAAVAPDWYDRLSAGGRAATFNVVSTDPIVAPATALGEAESVSTALDLVGLRQASPTAVELARTLERLDTLPADEDAPSEHLVVVWVDALADELVAADEPDANLLVEWIRDHPEADVHLLAANVTLFRTLSELLIDSGATVTAVPDPDDLPGLVAALPTPRPQPPIEPPNVRTARMVSGLTGQPIVLEIGVDVAVATQATISWAIDGRTVGSGQRVTLPGDVFAPGSTEVIVTVSFGPRVSRGRQASTEVLVSDDGDGVDDSFDACPAEFGPVHEDGDRDGRGNECDPDDDNDSIVDELDPCPLHRNVRLIDVDLDGHPDACDSDPANGIGADWDGDGTSDVADNCPATPNPGQSDTDLDGIGDPCDASNTSDRGPCTILGTAGDDRLVGTDGDDVICGFGGDDSLVGGRGADLLIGGAGNDVLHGNAGGDVLAGGIGDDRLLGGIGDDALLGGPGEDRLIGDEGDDTLAGHGGSDLLFGREDDDLLVSGNGSDTIRGGRGNDVIADVGARDRVDGGGGTDIVGGLILTID